MGRQRNSQIFNGSQQFEAEHIHLDDDNDDNPRTLNAESGKHLVASIAYDTDELIDIWPGACSIVDLEINVNPVFSCGILVF